MDVTVLGISSSAMEPPSAIKGGYGWVSDGILWKRIWSLLFLLCVNIQASGPGNFDVTGGVSGMS